MSNRQIAQQLFVTLRTIEVHLSLGYQKLDIAKPWTARQNRTDTWQLPHARAAHELIFSGCGPSGSLPGAAALRTVVNQLPGKGLIGPSRHLNDVEEPLLAVSVRTRSLKAPVITVAVGEQGSTSTPFRYRNVAPSDK